MKKNQRGYTAMELLIVVIVPMLILITFYVVGGITVSGVKVVTQQCGTEYSIEPLVNGNWFCPK